MYVCRLTFMAIDQHVKSHCTTSLSHKHKYPVLLGTKNWGCPPGAQFKAGKSMFPEPEGNRTCSMELLHFRSSLHNSFCTLLGFRFRLTLHTYCFSLFISHWAVAATSIAFCLPSGIISWNCLKGTSVMLQHSKLWSVILSPLHGDTALFPSTGTWSPPPHNSIVLKTMHVTTICFLFEMSMQLQYPLCMTAITCSWLLQHLMISYDHRWSAVVIPLDTSSLSPAARDGPCPQWDSRKVCSAPTLSSCSLNHLWVFADRFVSVSPPAALHIIEYPATKCSAPRRQRVWLSVRLDSSLGFCLIHAPLLCLPAGRQGWYLMPLSSLQLEQWPRGCCVELSPSHF